MDGFKVLTAFQPVKIADLAGTKAKLRLMTAGERAFALHGFDSVSLQAVAAEAGNRNKFAVQYHFETKRGLLEAILLCRRQALTKRRQQLLDLATERGIELDVATLLEIQQVPIVEQIGPNGETWFGRMLFQLLSRLEPWSNIPHGFGLQDEANATRTIWRMISAQLSHLDAQQREIRLSIASFSIPVALVDRENRIAAGEDVAPVEVWLADCLRMTSAGLTC
jgi:AcrR family transcriptional regulator